MHGNGRLALRIFKQMPLHSSSRWIVLLLSILACSCARQAGPDTFPVTGVVTMDGEPVSEANVSFEPVATGDEILSAQAVTDADGRFSLQTHIGNNQFKDGLQAGEYGVAIWKPDPQPPADMRRQPKNLLPEKYRSMATSGLRAKVVDGENDFQFSLD